MSLFICSKCGVVDDHSCCSPIKVDDKISKYPNMWLQDMQGSGIVDKSDIYILDDNNEKVLFKEASKVMMLCSECNLGKWHGEFDKEYPAIDSEQKYRSRVSKYGYIKKEVSVDDIPFDVLKRYVDWMSDGFNRKYPNLNLTNIYDMGVVDPRVLVVHEVFEEFKGDIGLTVIDGLFDDSETGDYIYNLSLFIKDCLLEKQYRTSSCYEHIETYLESKEAKLFNTENITMKEELEMFFSFREVILKSLSESRNKTNPNIRYYSFEDMLTHLLGSLSFINPTVLSMMKDNLLNNKKTRKRIIKPWKETQSEEDREYRLRKAEEKRQRKLEKKK